MPVVVPRQWIFDAVVFLLIVFVVMPYRSTRHRPTYIARYGLLFPMFRGLSVVCVCVLDTNREFYENG